MSEKSAKIVGSMPPRPLAADAGVAEAVVQRPLLAIGEHGVGLGRFLEFLFRLPVAGVAIGMVLQRELAVRALDLLTRSTRARRRGPRNSRVCSRVLTSNPAVLDDHSPLATFTIAGRIRRSPSM